MTDNTSAIIKDSIRTIPDYPKAGILFRDVTTLLKSPDAFGLACERLKSKSSGFPNFDFVAGIEARGFIFGSVLAYALGKGFVPIRKPGKLPAEIASVDYELEYGRDTVEVHVDAIINGAGYLVVDDLLATGGTANASCSLIENSGGIVAGCMFVVELPDLNGRSVLKDRMVYSILQFEGE
jgi:adenine phosphoribosyltransferase